MLNPQNNIGKKGIEGVINSDAVTAPTREVLNKRLVRVMTAEPKFFDKENFKILRAVCDRLLQQGDKSRRVDIAGTLDENLFQKKGKGWRYDVMRPMGEAFADGLHLIADIAQKEEKESFYKLSAEAQDKIIRVICNQQDGGKTGRFFEELLAAVAEIYYSHPYAKESINDLSFADAHGWEL